MSNDQRKRPAFAYLLARKLIPEAYREELLGDLLELYEERLNSSGVFTAYTMFWIDAIHLAGGFISIRKMKTQNNNYMIKNMFKVAWRNAIRQKQPAILNIAGLTIGIITFLVIGLFVHHESNFDKFHVNGDRIYRINQPDIWGDWQTKISSTGPNVATALLEEAPEFEEVTRLMDPGSQIINLKNAYGSDLSFKENRVVVVEDNFFNIFTFDFYEGDKQTAILNPNSIVMTKETAERYFGTDRPLNEALGRQVEIKQWDGKWKTFQVTGIMADIPTQS
ncbi:MAG: ABC transporter permease, partial [Bacteroidota bacterium]